MQGDAMLTHAVRRLATRCRDAREIIPAAILLLIFAVVPAVAHAAAPAAPDPIKRGPRLSSLQVEIWPEYDRPAMALVILRGEIAADVPLPAAVRLRVPVTSGGPTAVAYSAEPGGNMLNLKYDRKDAGDYIAISFDAPQRFFHVEFYDPLAPTATGRSYTYVWTGDLAADRLSATVQEPAAASDLSVDPALGAPATGQNGLRYRSADLGPFALGKRLELKLRYVRTDARTSVAILEPQTASPPPPPPVAGLDTRKLAVWLLAVVVVLAAAGLAGSLWWQRRKGAAAAAPGEAGFCRKCGARRASGDRFCSKCGARLREEAPKRSGARGTGS
jgi:hypothetical protein